MNVASVAAGFRVSLQPRRQMSRPMAQFTTRHSVGSFDEREARSLQNAVKNNLGFIR
jgi:hypothetical protein